MDQMLDQILNETKNISNDELEKILTNVKVNLISEIKLEPIRLLEKLKERCKENEKSSFEDKKKITE